MLAIDDNNGVGDTGYVSDSNILWEDMDNYIQQEIFSGMSWLQASDKGLTKYIKKIDKDIVQKNVTETSCYTEQFKHLRDNICFKWLGVNEWHLVTAEEFYTVTFHSNGFCIEAQSETVFLTKSACSHVSSWFFHFIGHMWKHLYISTFYQ